MRTYIYPNKLIVGEEYLIEDELFRHIFVVCRFEVGQTIQLMHGGYSFNCSIEKLAKKKAFVKVFAKEKLSEPKRPWIHFVLNFPKPSVFESVVEKLVEMGVKSIQPVISDYSFFKSISKANGLKRNRLNKIIESATQQSKRGDFMEIYPTLSLDSFMDSFKAKDGILGLFAYEKECDEKLCQFLNEKNLSNFSDIFIFVGSEGGYSKAELQLFLNSGLKPVSLGEQILRVETACVTLSGIIKYELERRVFT